MESEPSTSLDLAQTRLLFSDVRASDMKPKEKAAVMRSF